MPPDLRDVSLDALLRLVVREAVRDELREQLASVREQLEALTAASPPSLVDVAEAARRLGRSTASIRRACASGELPGVRLGRSWRINLAEIARRATPEHVAELAAEARSR